MTASTDTPSVAVSVTALGDTRYGRAARQTVLSLLDHTPFDVVATCDAANRAFMPDHERLRVDVVQSPHEHRADPFLAKFRSWQKLIETSAADVVIHVDADAVVVRPITADDVADALGVHAMAMVEQTGIRGSDMNRTGFLRHFTAHSMAAVAPAHRVPPEGSFRFYNSGTVLMRRLEMRNFLRWATELMPAVPRTVGEHMIADQDYLQVWANVLRGGHCAELDWSWNHCQWWDDDYPDPRARIVHLSNFCDGPTTSAMLEMQALRRRATLHSPADDGTDVTFVVVTHDSESVVADCLASLEQVPSSAVIVVDNGSTGGPPRVRGDVTVVSNHVNAGFATAANAGARLARSELVCFLNPDCVLTPELARHAVAAVGADPLVAVVPDYLGDDGGTSPGLRPGYTKRRLLRDLLEGNGHDRLARRLAPDVALDDPSWRWPVAACMFIDRKRFLAAGGFEESYLCYMEDVEFGLTWRRHGGRFVGAPEPAFHAGGAGSGITDARRRALLDRSRITYARRQHGVVLAGALTVLRLLLGLSPRTRALRRADRR